MKTSKLIGFLAVVALIAGIFWLSKSSSNGEKNNVINTGSGKLIATEAFYDFGGISMTNGKVSHKFQIKNEGNVALEIEKMYTSCMCTEASLIKNGEKFGPFGMPGHAFVPSLRQSLEAGESGEIEVVFDPAAHGPAGVGKIDRAIYLENGGKNLLELLISANVTP